MDEAGVGDFDSWGEVASAEAVIGIRRIDARSG
jgi:hypothetical protein